MSSSFLSYFRFISAKLLQITIGLLFGASLGYPSSSAGDITQPPWCAPAIAPRLHSCITIICALSGQHSCPTEDIETETCSTFPEATFSLQQPQPEQLTDAETLTGVFASHLGADEEYLSGHQSGSSNNSDGGLLWPQKRIAMYGVRRQP